MSCVLDYGQGAWGLMGSGGKWSRFSSNAAEHKVLSASGPDVVSPY